MTRRLVISPKAEADILATLEYTEIEWGVAQADVYLALLEKGFLQIRDNPLIGRIRPDISAKHRSFIIGKHIAIYFVEGNVTYLSRLLHHSRDIFSHDIT